MYYNDIRIKGKDEFKMKHMGKVHVLKYILLLIVAIGVGVGGYEIGVTHSQNQKAYQVVQSKKANQNPVSDKKTKDTNTDAKNTNSDDEISSSNTESVETYSGNINNYYNSDSDTFMGCKSLSDFYSKYGETPCAYLLDKGFTKDEIFSMMKQIPNYHQWMTSSEIQTMNENNN